MDRASRAKRRLSGSGCAGCTGGADRQLDQQDRKRGPVEKEVKIRDGATLLMSPNLEQAGTVLLSTCIVG